MKNLIIVVLILLTVLAVVNAYLQMIATDKARAEAELNAHAAIEMRALADKNAGDATVYRNENRKLLDSLKNCKGR